MISSPATIAMAAVLAEYFDKAQGESMSNAARQKRYRDGKRSGGDTVGKDGFVYILQSGDSNYYKIGCTVNRPLARVRELQTGSPVELKLYEVFHSTDMDALEQDGQDKVKASHVRGEWFELTRAEVDRLASYLARDAMYFYYDKQEQERAMQAGQYVSLELADYEYNDVLPAPCPQEAAT